jgi:hypothetical protein
MDVEMAVTYLRLCAWRDWQKPIKALIMINNFRTGSWIEDKTGQLSDKSMIITMSLSLLKHKWGLFFNVTHKAMFDCSLLLLFCIFLCWLHLWFESINAKTLGICHPYYSLPLWHWCVWILMEKIILKKSTVLQPANKFPDSNLKFIFEKLIFRKPSEWHTRALARYV